LMGNLLAGGLRLDQAGGGSRRRGKEGDGEGTKTERGVWGGMEKEEEEGKGEGKRILTREEIERGGGEGEAEDMEEKRRWKGGAGMTLMVENRGPRVPGSKDTQCKSGQSLDGGCLGKKDQSKLVKKKPVVPVVCRGPSAV